MKTFTIKEVSQLSGVSTYTLRFWEKELKGVIVPHSTKGGQRRYTLRHLLVIEEIKGLKRKGLSLADIKRELNRSLNSNEEHNNQVEVLAKRISEIVRAAISNFLNSTMAKE